MPHPRKVADGVARLVARGERDDAVRLALHDARLRPNECDAQEIAARALINQGRADLAWERYEMAWAVKDRTSFSETHIADLLMHRILCYDLLPESTQDGARG